MEKSIVLNVNGEPLKFKVTADNHEKLINEMQPNNKVAPMHNFLTRSVEAESKDALKPYLENSAHVLEIGGQLIEEFVPKLKVTVGE